MEKLCCRQQSVEGSPGVLRWWAVRDGEVVCLILGMQLQVSPSTATNFVLSEKARETRSCMSNTRHATASVVFECNCMSTQMTATNICFRLATGEGAVAYLRLGMQLQVSRLTAIACPPK